jgi:DMSO reductase anchor subunit
MKAFKALSLCMLAALPWQIVSAEVTHQSKLAQLIAYKTYGAGPLIEFVALIAAMVGVSFVFSICCMFVSKKLAKRRECAAEKSRS